MRKNVGSYDAGIRFVAGCLFLLGAINGFRWGWTGLPLVVTSFGYCPVWWLLRVDTTACDRADDEP